MMMAIVVCLGYLAITANAGVSLTLSIFVGKTGFDDHRYDDDDDDIGDYDDYDDVGDYEDVSDYGY